MSRNRVGRAVLELGLAFGFVAASVPVVRAQDMRPFYKGRTLTISVPAGPGGGFDLYTRAFSRYLPKHIPGNPNIIIQNIPAAGGLVLANQLFFTAPKDGTYIGMVRGTVMQQELFKDPRVRFVSKKFEWIANLDQENDTCLVGAASKVRTVNDFYKYDVTLGASGVGAQSYSLPTAYRQILGMKLKVINGYPETPERILAMERGEITGACGITMSEYRSNVRRLVAEGKAILIAQAGLHKDPRYPDVPNMLDQAKTPEARQMLTVLLTPLQLTHPLAAPPGAPRDRLAILRRAVMETLKDPEFLAFAEHIQIDVQPMNDKETRKAIDSMFEAPPEAVARIKQLIGD